MITQLNITEQNVSSEQTQPVAENSNPVTSEPSEQKNTEVTSQSASSTETSTQYRVPTKEIFEPNDLKKWEESEVSFIDYFT